MLIPLILLLLFIFFLLRFIAKKTINPFVLVSKGGIGWIKLQDTFGFINILASGRHAIGITKDSTHYIKISKNKWAKSKIPRNTTLKAICDITNILFAITGKNELISYDYDTNQWELLHRFEINIYCITYVKDNILIGGDHGIITFAKKINTVNLYQYI
jgi:hypothetical protein